MRKTWLKIDKLDWRKSIQFPSEGISKNYIAMRREPGENTLESVFTARLRPKVQPLFLLYTLMNNITREHQALQEEMLSKRQVSFVLFMLWPESR